MQIYPVLFINIEKNLTPIPMANEEMLAIWNFQNIKQNYTILSISKCSRGNK